MVVVRQGHIEEFRAVQMNYDKAQPAGNGKVLCKGCNAVVIHPGRSLRASREAVVLCVAPLGKGMPFPARCALRSTASRLAEPINMALSDH
jgi:hypothetical protein